MDFETHPGRPEDIPAVLEFARENYAFHALPFDEAGCRSALEELVRSEDAGRMLVAWSGGEPVGYAVFAFCFSLEFGGREAFYASHGYLDRSRFHLMSKALPHA